jgi:cytosine/adenosine deaminase-related metal-dependent hydrolase
MVSIDFNDPAAQPVLKPLSSLVHTSAKKVSNVWVGGRRLVENEKVTSLKVDMTKVDYYRTMILKHMQN